MEIKTVWGLIDRSAQFDEEVNTALRDGWTLVKRDVLPGERYTETNWVRRVLYAELERTDPDEEDAQPTLLERIVALCEQLEALRNSDPEVNT